MKKQAPLQRKDALKGKSFLLQQIEHGDFNYSNYKSQAEDELVRATTEKAALLKNWKASKESYNEACHEIDRKYRKRYNKLMEDHLNEETKLLSVLKKRLILEFKKDVWESVVNSCQGDLVSFYNEYKQVAKLTK